MKNERKILIVGEVDGIFVDTLYSGFRKIGYGNVSVYEVVKARTTLWSKLMNRTFLRFIYLSFSNKRFVEYLLGNEVDVVFYYRATGISLDTIKRIGKEDIIQLGYHNDDPFRKEKLELLDGFVDKARHFDWIFCFRTKNISEFRALGYSNSSLLLPYIDPQRSRIETGSVKYACDVLFIGHYEPDGRDSIFLRLLEEGFDLKIFGSNWSASPLFEKLQSHLGYKIEPVIEDYNKALNSAKMSIVMLSKLNNDDYTIRQFEIAATKSCLLSIRSATLESWFRPGQEALYFDSYDDLPNVIRNALINEDIQSISRCANLRVKELECMAEDRAKEILLVLEKHVID